MLDGSRGARRPAGQTYFYEPPVPQDGNFYPPGSIEGLEALLQQGDRTGVITTFLRDFLHLSPLELELVSYLPVWPARVAAAHTIPRELRQIQAYRLQSERFGAVKAPSLLVLGGDSPPKMTRSIEALHQALPNSQVVVIPGQQHNAISMAPDVFAREVLRSSPKPKSNVYSRSGQLAGAALFVCALGDSST